MVTAKKKPRKAPAKKARARKTPVASAWSAEKAAHFVTSMRAWCSNKRVVCESTLPEPVEPTDEGGPESMVELYETLVGSRCPPALVDWLFLPDVTDVLWTAGKHQGECLITNPLMAQRFPSDGNVDGIALKEFVILDQVVRHAGNYYPRHARASPALFSRYQA